MLVGRTAIASHIDREQATTACYAKMLRQPDAFEPVTKKAAAVPMSLTASDGSGLVLEALLRESRHRRLQDDPEIAGFEPPGDGNGWSLGC